MENKITFSFGKNWKDFIEFNFTEERIEIAKKHILNFIGLNNLNDKSFLDIGCGSGLHSFAAYLAGAKNILSFDLDIQSVKTTQKLKEKAGNPGNWTILNGSILDENFISKIERADIVYSWGVLHHTGNMWKAIENASKLLKDKNSLFYIALYTTTNKSDYWIKIKKKYNNSGFFGKKILELKYVLKSTILLNILRGRNPVSFIKNYKKDRGMSYFINVKDWLGGYPYEDAKIEEVLKFCRNKLYLELINLSTGEANTEYLFIKK